MSVRRDPRSGRSRGEWPPGWVEEAALRGIDPAVWASTPAGAVYLEVWRAFPDATPWEHGLAAVRAPGQPWLVARDAVAGIAGVREARPQRPDLSENHWQRLVGQFWERLTQPRRSDPRAILAEVDAIRPMPRPRRPGGAPRLPEHEARRDLEAALAKLQAQGVERPTREAIAAAHSPDLSVRGLQKRLAAYPRLRDLLR